MPHPLRAAMRFYANVSTSAGAIGAIDYRADCCQRRGDWRDVQHGEDSPLSISFGRRGPGVRCAGDPVAGQINASHVCLCAAFWWGPQSAISRCPRCCGRVGWPGLAV